MCIVYNNLYIVYNRTIHHIAYVSCTKYNTTYYFILSFHRIQCVCVCVCVYIYIQTYLLFYTIISQDIKSKFQIPGVDVPNQQHPLPDDYPFAVLGTRCRTVAAEDVRGHALNPTARSVRPGRCARALGGTRTHTMRAAAAAIGTHGAAAHLDLYPQIDTAYSLVCFPAARCDAGGPLRSPPLPLGEYSHLRGGRLSCGRHFRRPGSGPRRCRRAHGRRYPQPTSFQARCYKCSFPAGG